MRWNFPGQALIGRRSLPNFPTQAELAQMTATTIIAIAVMGLVAVLLLRQLAWFSVGIVIRSARRLSPGLLSMTRWASTHPFQTHLTSRYPRLSGFLRARLDPGRFSALPLTLMSIAALYLVVLLGGLVEDLLSYEGIVRFDIAINTFFAPYRVQPLITVFLWITTLGTGAAITAVAMTATGFLWADRRASLIPPLWVTLIGAEATTWAGKYVVGRPRPQFIEAASAASPSFPSGHATASMAVYGFLAYAIARELPRLRQRFEIAFWAVILIATIGFSRIFLSLHYTTDVLSGFLVGGFWLLVGFAAAERARESAL